MVMVEKWQSLVCSDLNRHNATVVGERRRSRALLFEAACGVPTGRQRDGCSCAGRCLQPRIFLGSLRRRVVFVDRSLEAGGGVEAENR
jgi:hypothetical protein